MKTIAKTAGMTVVAWAVALFVLGGILAVGIPEVILAPVAWLAFAYLGYTLSKNLFDSKKPWAWAIAGAVFGMLAFPFLWYCHERYMANWDAAIRELATEVPTLSPQKEFQPL